MYAKPLGSCVGFIAGIVPAARVAHAVSWGRYPRLVNRKICIFAPVPAGAARRREDPQQLRMLASNVVKGLTGRAGQWKNQLNDR